jgi:hypothetical protein
MRDTVSGRLVEVLAKSCKTFGYDRLENTQKQTHNVGYVLIRIECPASRFHVFSKFGWWNPLKTK